MALAFTLSLHSGSTRSLHKRIHPLPYSPLCLIAAKPQILTNGGLCDIENEVSESRTLREH